MILLNFLIYLYDCNWIDQIVFVLMVLYAARMGRPDFYWAVNTLAREVTRWSVACDKSQAHVLHTSYETICSKVCCW